MDSPLGNGEIATILTQLQKFWIKWRDRVSDKDFDEWDEIMRDASKIMEFNGVHMVRKWEGSLPTMEEEAVTAPLVNWFLDQLEARSRKGQKK